MIHTIYVSAQSEPEELRKLFRKKLMTGGAVVRLVPGLRGEDLEAITKSFLPGAERHNLNSMVLSEVARATELSDETLNLLEQLPFENIKRVLDRMHPQRVAA